MILNKIFSYVLNKFEKKMKSKSISYVLFDYFYLKKICKDINNNFFRLGYEKINSNFSGFVEKINNLEEELSLLTDEELKNKTNFFKDQLKKIYQLKT